LQPNNIGDLAIRNQTISQAESSSCSKEFYLLFWNEAQTTTTIEVMEHFPGKSLRGVAKYSPCLRSSLKDKEISP